MSLTWAIVIGVVLLLVIYVWRLHETDDFGEAALETVLGIPVVAVVVYLLVVAVAFMAAVGIAIAAVVVVLGALLAAGS